MWGHTRKDLHSEFPLTLQSHHQNPGCENGPAGKEEWRRANPKASKEGNVRLGPHSPPRLSPRSRSRATLPGARPSVLRLTGPLGTLEGQSILMQTLFLLYLD